MYAAYAQSNDQKAMNVSRISRVIVATAAVALVGASCGNLLADVSAHRQAVRDALIAEIGLPPGVPAKTTVEPAGQIAHYSDVDAAAWHDWYGAVVNRIECTDPSDVWDNENPVNTLHTVECRATRAGIDFYVTLESFSQSDSSTDPDAGFGTTWVGVFFDSPTCAVCTSSPTENSGAPGPGSAALIVGTRG